MVITRELLRAWGACYSDERIAELVPESGLTPLEVCDLPIPSEDRLWTLLRPEVLGSAFSVALADIVQRALDRAVITDPRSRDVVVALREGRAPDLAAARAADAADAADAAAGAEVERQTQLEDVRRALGGAA